MTPAVRLSVPGPPSAPLLGPSAAVFRLLRDPLGEVGRLFRSYGPVVSLVAGGGTRLYSSWNPCPGSVYAYRPEHVQEVTTRHETYHKHPLSLTLFAKAGQSARTEPLKHFGTGLFGVNDDEHRRHRRLLMPSFQKKHVEGYRDDIVAITQNALQGWRPGEARDVAADMRLLSLRIATQTLFGGDVGPEGSRLGETFAESLTLLASPLTVMLPFDLPGLPYRRFLSLAADLDAEMRHLIARKRAAPGQADDMLSMLFRARDEETGHGLGDDDLLGHMSSLFGASHETTASALTWALFLLSQHPRVASDLLDEIAGLLRGDPPSLADLERLPFLDRVVKESLRIIPPVLFNGRILARPAELGGYLLPLGTEVFVSLYHTHHMPDLFPRPEAFDPGRWETINPTVFQYDPFSAGPRMCIGATFAVLELKIVLAILVQRHRLELAHPARVDRSGLIVLAPKAGLCMTAQPQDREFDRGVGGVRGNVREMVELPV
jgi:cytochrome P450